MKKLLFLSLCILCIVACQQKQDGFTITGTLQGEAEGGKVLLQNTNVYPPVTLDSTLVKDGKFILKGKVDSPALYSIVIDINEPDAEQPDFRNKVLKADLYVENSDITFEGDVATLPAYYWNPDRNGKAVIKGSASQDLFEKFKEGSKDVRAKLGDVREQYSKEYIIPEMDGKDVTARGIEIVKQEKVLQKEMQDITLKFIKDNAASVVAFDQLTYEIAGIEVPYTVEQIDEMMSWVEGPWAGTKQLEDLKASAAKAKKMAIGQKFIDAEFVNPKGEKVMLSSLMPKDKYVMLEFWASWCGPCRGEIPHLVKVHNKYKDFEIISISIDEKDAEWQKAMKEEGMVWKQLRNPQGFKGVIQDEYNIQGVPTCIILDKEGRHYKTNMRGAYLDEFLLETYGK